METDDGEPAIARWLTLPGRDLRGLRMRASVALLVVCILGTFPAALLERLGVRMYRRGR